MNRSLVAILGPTAVGKSTLALKLAREFHGEIVSADSRQVYRQMDIGTAKPTREDQIGIPHHLIDLVNPDENFSLAQYLQVANQTISSIQARGRLPILVGGSGLYVRAVLEGLTIPRVAPDAARRRELERLAPHLIFARLQRLDPNAASKIDPRNTRRVIRAIEVCEATRQPISGLQTRDAPNYRVLRLGLTMPREQLYERINAAVDEMLARGLVDEVRALIAQGYSPDLPSMSGLGYRQIATFLQGELPFEEAVRLLKRDTRRFVHHQYSWFRLDDARFKWFDVSVVGYEQIRKTAADFIANTLSPKPINRSKCHGQ